MINFVDQMYHEIGSKVRSITCEELYRYKRDFYDACHKYMNHTDNLTGITELLINLFFANYIQYNKYTIVTNHTEKGINGRENELDLALMDSNGKVVLGCSVKHKYSGTSWEKHEKESDTCSEFKRQYGSKNIAQDLFRIMNIKSVSSYKYPTITIIFDDLENEKQVEILKKIEGNKEYNHHYVVLEKNSEVIYDLIDLILNESLQKKVEFRS